MKKIQVDKQRLRIKAQNNRDKMPAKTRRNLSQKICRLAKQLIDTHQPNSILLYLHMRSEVETSYLLESQLSSDRLVGLPRVEEQNLKIYQIQNPDIQFQSHKWGMKEPDPDQCTSLDSNFLDMILVPGCVFDKFGYRLGYGGGFYDRLLANCPRALLVGLAFSVQIVDLLPSEDWDYPVDFILTENGVISCFK